MFEKPHHTEEQIQAARKQRTLDIALLEAAKHNNLTEVKRLYREGANIVGWESHNRTALHHAALGGYYDLAKFMLEHGAEVDARDSSLRTPLHFAADEAHCALIRLLIQHGAAIEGPDPSTSTTPLHFAVIRNRPDAVKTLLELRADVNMGGGPFHGTPLQTAARQGNMAMVRILLEHGADASHTDERGQTAESLAEANGYRTVAALLQAHQEGKIEELVRVEELNAALIDACEQNDLLKVRDLLEAGANVNCYDPAPPERSFAALPLTIAARNGSEELAAMLLEYGAEVDKRDSGGYRSLQYAAENGHLGFIRLLVEHGAEVNLCYWSDWEAVQLAVSEGQLDALKLLVELGANVNTEDTDGWTLLRIAADDADNAAVVAYLIEKGADVNKGDDGGYTPLHAAAYFGHTSIAKLLLENGADVNAVGRPEFLELRTPLDEAMKYEESTSVAELLKAHGGKTYAELQ